MHKFQDLHERDCEFSEVMRHLADLLLGSSEYAKLNEYYVDADEQDIVHYGRNSYGLSLLVDINADALPAFRAKLNYAIEELIHLSEILDEEQDEEDLRSAQDELDGIVRLCRTGK